MTHPSTSAESGFTLLELLLVIGIAAVMIAGAMQLAHSWTERELTKGAGQQIEQIGSVVDDFAKRNWVNMFVRQETRDIAASVDWPDLVTALEEAGLMSGGYIFSPLGPELRVGFKIVSGTPAAHDRIFHFYIYSVARIPESRARAAARAGGPFAGTWLEFPDPDFAYGAYGQWKMAKSVFNPSSNPPPNNNIFSMTPADGEGYLLSVIVGRETELAGPYLYRDDIGNNTAQTMHMDLDMNGHDISNVGVLNAQQATLDGLTVTGPTTLNNGANIAGALQADSLDIPTGTVNAGTINAGNCLSVGNMEYPGGTPTGPCQ